jgi:hypothetical protein
MKTRCPAAPNPVTLPSRCIGCSRLYDPTAKPLCTRLTTQLPVKRATGRLRTPLAKLVSPRTQAYLSNLAITTLGQLVATRLEGIITDHTPTDIAIEAMHAYESGYKKLNLLPAPKPKRQKTKKNNKPTTHRRRPPRDQRISSALAKANLATSVFNLGLSKPALGYLVRAGIKTWGQLARADLSTVIEKKTTVDTIAQLCQAYQLGQDLLPRVDEDAQQWIELGI